MDQKLQFISAVLRKEATVTQLCLAYGISRKTGYKWLERYRYEGATGLNERSRARHTQENETSRMVVDLLLEERRTRPTWGPRKLVTVLAKKWPNLRFPSHSTAAAILKQYGLSKPRRRRSRTPAFNGRLATAGAPNSVWCADFKGNFRLGNHKQCYPLTVTDQHSRYLLCCEALLRTDFTAARMVIGNAFIEYGMPDVVRTDNGPPFASPAPGGLSRLAIWMIKLGVRPERIDKGKPTQNGRHERMHRTLKLEAIQTPSRDRLKQQRVFDLFRADFNNVRPHEALGQVPPAEVYVPSAKKYPGCHKDPEYPTDFEAVRVRGDGVLKWLGNRTMITELLSGEVVGLEDVEDEGWNVHFGPVELGRLNRDGRFKPLR